MRIIILICLLKSGFVFAQTNVINMIADVNKAKISAESILTSTPYRQNEHQVIRDYFVALKGFSEEIKSTDRLNRRFNSYVREIGIKKFCTEILMTLADWEQIKINCTRNRFFLCSNEVLEYLPYKKLLAEILAEDMKIEFINTNECH